MLPRKGQPFLPERRNCSHTFRGGLQLRLPSAPQRYNTLDFPGESRVPRNRRFLWILPDKGKRCFPLESLCQQGCCSPLLEAQSQGVRVAGGDIKAQRVLKPQETYAPLDTLRLYNDRFCNSSFYAAIHIAVTLMILVASFDARAFSCFENAF